MKKLTTSLLAVAVAATLMPGVTHATETTTGSDSVDPTEPPTECTVDFPEWGPARTVHGRADTKRITPVLPACEDVEGICVEVVWPEPGPARIAHRPATETTAEVPCVPIDPACEFEYDPVPPKGPARNAHQPARPAGAVDYVTVPIPEECQEALSEALVPAGSDSGTIVWLAALFVGLGGAMVVTRRAIAIRTR